MTRLPWQQIAEERLQAASALLAANLWSSAYYISGYAVECGLKSCILKRVAAAPEVLCQEGGNRFSTDCWSHDLEKLVRLADLETIRNADIVANVALGANWGIVSKWTEKSRYQSKLQAEAEELYNAIADNANGVMGWIRARW